jgi:hypothetical protein
MGIRRASTYNVLYHNNAAYDSTAGASVLTTQNLQIGYTSTRGQMVKYMQYFGFGKSMSWIDANAYMKIINSMETILSRNKY